MPRTARIAPGGFVFHVLNRANARAEIFRGPPDYASFERALVEVYQHLPMRILAYCIMPNHWHLVLWPRGDGDLGRFLQRLTTTHVRRWHLAHGSVGWGHLYQGTYKSFPIQRDAHFLTVCRYVERNPLRGRLVRRAENWRWCSLWARGHPQARQEKPPLSPWPVELPGDWLELVNQSLTAAELEAVRLSVNRGRPFGGERWQRGAARRLGLESTFRPRGRPRKAERPTGLQ